MAILYTIDSITVDKDEFKSIITDMGYYNLKPEDMTWTHMAGHRQITMIKKLTDKNNVEHIFRFTVDT